MTALREKDPRTQVRIVGRARKCGIAVAPWARCFFFFDRESEGRASIVGLAQKRALRSYLVLGPLKVAEQVQLALVENRRSTRGPLASLRFVCEGFTSGERLVDSFFQRRPPKKQNFPT